MLMFPDAKQIARDRVAKLGDALVLYDEPLALKAYGWVFAYESREYLESYDEVFALVGNAPFLVLRADGRVLELGSHMSVDTYLLNYELTGDPLSTPEPQLYVTDWMAGMNGVGAMKLLHDALGMEVRDAKIHVQACIAKIPIKLKCANLNQAYKMQERLAGFGFITRFAPNWVI